MPNSIFNSYVDHFNGEKPFECNHKENLKYILIYLSELKKRSDGSYKNQKNILKRYFTYINRPIIKNGKQNIFMWDSINYFNEKLKYRNITNAYKNVIRASLKSFFNSVIGQVLQQKVIFQNPIPNKNIYKFPLTERDFKKKSEKDQKKLSKIQLLQILKYTRMNFQDPKKWFILFGLCICTGARISEIRTLKVKDVNIELRFLETGLEKNARKSTRFTNEGLLFFFPKNFKPYLKNYIMRLQRNGIKWMFPGRNASKPMVTSNVEYAYQKIGRALGFHFTMHYFRHSMISHLKSNKCIRDDREMLLNHVPSSTQGRIYEHDEIDEMREIYDKYFPYYSFPYF